MFGWNKFVVVLSQLGVVRWLREVNSQTLDLTGVLIDTWHGILNHVGWHVIVVWLWPFISILKLKLRLRLTSFTFWAPLYLIQDSLVVRLSSRLFSCLAPRWLLLLDWREPLLGRRHTLLTVELGISNALQPVTGCHVGGVHLQWLHLFLVGPKVDYLIVLHALCLGWHLILRELVPSPMGHVLGLWLDVGNVWAESLRSVHWLVLC